MEMRKRMLLAAGAVLALAAGTLTMAAVRAEDPAPGAAAEGRAPGSGAGPEDLEALVKSLGDPAFSVRERAHDRLREAGAAARPALERGAASEDPQVRWAAGRLLRLLDEATGAGEERGPRERALRRWLEPPEAGSRFGGPGAWESLDRAMEDLRGRMRDLERGLDGLHGPGLRLEFPGPGGAATERRILVEDGKGRLEVHVDGEGRVKATVTDRTGGETGTSTLEAESLEAFAREHPALHGRVEELLGAPAPSLREFRFPAWPFAGSPDRRGPPGSGREGERRGDDGGGEGRLGAMVAPLPEILRVHLRVPGDRGLVVEEVLPGTPAARLGLRRNDLLLGVNGIPVASAGEVRSALGAIPRGGSLGLKVLREGAPLELSGAR